MLLAIDIGNTNIGMGIFKGDRMLNRYTISTKERRYLEKIKSLVFKNKIEDAIICSVVPEATRRLKQDLEKCIDRKPYVLGRNVEVPIKNLYRKPKQVGQDRLVNAYAGIKFYGAPLIVIDFGTALTFDIVSRNKEYWGGLILPGLKISLDALSKNTALLPKVSLSGPKELIGRETRNSMLSGLVYGFAGLVTNLIDRLRRKIGKAKVIGTGGDVILISKHCKLFDKIDKDLTLKGLNLIYKMERRKNDRKKRI